MQATNTLFQELSIGVDPTVMICSSEPGLTALSIHLNATKANFMHFCLTVRPLAILEIARWS